MSPATAGATLAHETPAGASRFPRLLPRPARAAI